MCILKIKLYHRLQNLQVNVQNMFKIQCNVHGMSENECVKHHCQELEYANFKQAFGTRSKVLL